MNRSSAILPLTAVLVMTVLAGCAPSIVPQQKEIAGDSIGLSNVPAPAIADKWWEAFGDRELDRLVDQALAGSPALGEALARLRAAKAGVESANASLFPRVDFNGQEQRTRFSETYIIP